MLALLSYVGGRNGHRGWGVGVATRLRDVQEADDPSELFAGVVTFLGQHWLSPDPVNYAFAYDIVRNPGGARAREVARLTQNGIRLSGGDILRLGGSARNAPPIALLPFVPPVEPAGCDERDVALVARALAQVDGFTDTLHTIHSETNDFGRDLAATAETMRDGGEHAGVERIAHLTAAMIERVHRAETRLEQAKHETAELRAELEEARSIAQTDPLTELPNRRAFDDAFAALAPGTAVALAICDIDYFKRVNDDFGHAVGDRVLKLVAQSLQHAVGCTVARYGGEEFALLFTDVDAGDALARIDAARAAITRRRLRDRDSDRPIGTIDFSAGLATGVARDTLPALMKRADRALYGAKQAGRGCTIVAP